MKLTLQQVQQIEKHLDFKGLTQVDLKNEVLDHMALNIEKAMEHGNHSFINVFNAEMKKWNNDLKNHSSVWLGLLWVGPKIMIEKCVKEVKQMYLWSGILTVALLFFSFCLNKLFKIELLATEIKRGLGSLYLIIFILVVIGFCQMKYSSIQTTYSYLYKLNIIGFGFLYLMFNPLWNEVIVEALFNEDALFAAFFHSVLLTFGYQFWVLYNKHFKAKKILIA